MYLTPIIAMHETTARDVVYKKKWSKQKEIKSIIHPHSHTCQSKRGLGRIYGPIQYSQVSLKRLSTVRFCTRLKIKTLVYCTVLYERTVTQQVLAGQQHHHRYSMVQTSMFLSVKLRSVLYHNP